VQDDRLKLLAQRWFEKQTMAGSKMAWQIWLTCSFILFN
jgi:hypothetical protein